ncbi:MAG: outer membrane beta-barrel protein [Bacteroides sp.]|nr:outer membrane beta-barrel protein [Bacteroides sp.]
MKRTHVLSIIIMMLAALHLQAQTINGQLTDEQGQPLPYANVVLLSLPDSSFVAGTVTDENGTFALENDGQGKLIRISSIGYVTLYRMYSSNHLGTLQMTSDAQTLDEVTVKADLPKTRLKGDAMITGVSGTILEKAGTAEDLLNKIPNVMAGDGTVEVLVRGKPEIYINGRKVRNNAELDQLSSENIKSVEVVNNPGARYDASVTSVIRIITKKPQGEGFGFNNRLNVRNKRSYGWGGVEQFDFNYRKGGFDLAGMLKESISKGGDEKTLYTHTYAENHWMQKMQMPNVRQKDKSFAAMLSLNYQLNPHYTFGIRYDYDRDYQSDWTGDILTDVYRDNILLENSFSSLAIQSPVTDHRANFYYNGKVSEWLIDLNLDGVWNDNKVGQTSYEKVTDLSETEEERHVNTFSQKKNQLYAGKLVLSHPFLNGNVTLGGEYSHNKRTNLYENEEGILEDDDSYIKEGSASAFAELSQTFGEVYVQTGLRYEQVDFDYYDRGVRMDEQCKTYRNLFPSVVLTFPIGKAQMQLTYATEISRPSYWTLRKNITYGNSYTYETGNPFLRPTHTQSIMFSASYQWVNLSAGYYHIKNGIESATTAYREDDPTIVLLTYRNMPSFDKMFASLTLNPTFGFWSPQLNIGIQRQWYNASTPDGEKCFNHPIGMFRWRNNFKLPAGISLDVDGMYQTKGQNDNMHITRAAWKVDFSLQKSFCKDRLNILFRGRDLFESNYTVADMYCGARVLNFHGQTRRQWEMTVRYRFNSTKSKYKGTGAGQSQKSRM